MLIFFRNFMFTSESLSLFRGIVSKFQYWLIFHAEKYLTFLHIIFKCIVTAVNLKNLHFFTKNLLTKMFTTANKSPTIHTWLYQSKPSLLKDWNYYEVKLHFKSTSISTDKSRTWRLSSFYCISIHKNFMPKHLDNALVDFDLT